MISMLLQKVSERRHFKLFSLGVNTIKMRNKKLIDLIKEYENNFTIVKKRFYYLENILEELEKTTEGHRFDIRGDVVYQMLRDSYNMLIIDLASIARGMIRKKGFFRQLPSHIPELPLPTKKLIAQSYHATYGHQDPIAESIILNNCLDSFNRLFPKCIQDKRKKPDHRDLVDLKDRFHIICEAIIKDRDRNRAHRYELPEQAKESVKLLSILDLDAKFEKIEELMNDLRMVCSHTSFGSSDVNFSNSKRTAQSIVDMVLIGDHNSINIAFGISQDMKDSFGIYPWQYRDEYYDVMRHNYKLLLQEVNEEEARKYREKHQSYSKIKIPKIAINHNLYLNYQ